MTGAALPPSLGGAELAVPPVQAIHKAYHRQIAAYRLVLLALDESHDHAAVLLHKMLVRS